MRTFETALHVAALGAVIWAVGIQLPRARREQGAFAIMCSLLTAVLALAVWLFFGIGVASP